MMGTKVTISLVDATGEQAARALQVAFAEFDRVNEVMNEWRSDSPLSAINAAAGTGKFVPAPEDLCDVLRRSLDAAARTMACSIQHGQPCAISGDLGRTRSTRSRLPKQ